MQGTSMIATEPSGMVDMVGDDAGMLVPQGDPVALADAMQSLIDDPARRRALQRAGQARATQFDAEAVLDPLREMLGRVAAGR